MKYLNLEIPELILCTPEIYEDNRGYVYESFQKKSFNEFVGLNIDFKQDNLSFSNQNVIRGLHINTLEYSQSKLINVIKGKILDIAVDFRKGSPTYGKYISCELSCSNKKQLFVPRGFLHGFSVLSNTAIVNIKVDRYFKAGESIGIKFNDKSLNIDWKIVNEKAILSYADKYLNSFKTFNTPYIYGQDFYKDDLC